MTIFDTPKKGRGNSMIRKYRKLFMIPFILFVIFFCASVAYCDVLYVPGKFNTIQSAINAANSGDTIIVGTGSYKEEVTLKDGITLKGLGLPTIGSNSPSDIPSGNVNFSVGNNCIVDGFKIHSMSISGKSNVVVQNCALLAKDNSLTALTITSSQDILLENNIFSDEFYGGATGSKISVSNVRGLTFRDNMVFAKDNAAAPANLTGISLSTVSDSSLTNNLIKAETLGTGGTATGINLANILSTEIKNNIIYGTTYAIDGNSTGAVITYDNLPEGLSHVGTNIVLGANNMSVEPVFSTERTFYLKPSSPCVDAGIKLGAFPLDTAPDMGAYRCAKFLKTGESLQAAINNANPNDTIYLDPGVYSAEALTIKTPDGSGQVSTYGIFVTAKDIHIIGSGKDNTFIEGPVVFIFSDGSIENLTVKSPNDNDLTTEIDSDMDGREDYSFTGSLFVANGSPAIDNVMLEPDFAVLASKWGISVSTYGTGIAVMENTSGSPAAPIITNTVLKKFDTAVVVEGKNDQIVLSPAIKHCVFDQNTKGVDCKTSLALFALENNILTNQSQAAINIAATPYKDIILSNIQNNLFYGNAADCLYNGASENIFASYNNNQHGDPRYLSPTTNSYATLFNSPAINLDAGLEHYEEIASNGNILYYESPEKQYLLANVTKEGLPANSDFAKIITKYDVSLNYAGETREYYDLEMKELLFYSEYNASEELLGTYYADGTPYPFTGASGVLTVSLTSPNGGGALKGVIPVKWTASDSNDNPITIDLYYTLNSVDYQPIAKGLANDGEYAWVTMDESNHAACPDSNTYKVRVVAYETTEHGVSAQRDSASTFALDNTPPAIAITSPAENTNWGSAPVAVTGTALDNNISSVQVMVTDVSDWQPAIIEGNNFSTDVTLPGSGMRAIVVVKATDAAGNISTDQVEVIKGYMLFIDLPVYYNTSQSQGLSSLTAAKDILRLMRPEATGMPTDTDIYNHGHQLNLPANASLNEFDPRGMMAVLCKFDSYDTQPTGNYGNGMQGYNFTAEGFENTTAGYNSYLKEIIRWMSWPVSKGPYYLSHGGTDLVEEPYAPGAVPLYADTKGYNRWIITNGYASDVSPFRDNPNPWSNPYNVLDITVYGLFLTDTAQNGIGQDIYIASSSLGDYLRPLAAPNAGDTYNGKYVMVAEPPAEEFKLNTDMAPSEVNKSTLNLIGMAEYATDGATTPMDKHLIDSALAVNLDKNDGAVSFSTNANLLALFKPELLIKEDSSKISWKDVVGPSLLLNEKFKSAIENSTVREFIKVRRNDTGKEYYIIPFDKLEAGRYYSYAAIIVDAEDGHFMEGSYVEEPAIYVQISEEEAINKVLESMPEAAADKVEAVLAWEPKGATLSPFYPYWEVTVGDKKFYVASK